MPKLKHKDQRDIVITVQAVSKLGDEWAEFVAGEVARLVDELCAFQVTMMGDFVLTNDHADRVARVLQLDKATRADVMIEVQPRSQD